MRQTIFYPLIIFCLLLTGCERIDDDDPQCIYRDDFGDDGVSHLTIHAKNKWTFSGLNINIPADFATLSDEEREQITRPLLEIKANGLVDLCTNTQPFNCNDIGPPADANKGAGAVYGNNNSINFCASHSGKLADYDSSVRAEIEAGILRSVDPETGAETRDRKITDGGWFKSGVTFEEGQNEITIYGSYTDVTGQERTEGQGLYLYINHNPAPDGSLPIIGEKVPIGKSPDDTNLEDPYIFHVKDLCTQLPSSLNCTKTPYTAEKLITFSFNIDADHTGDVYLRYARNASTNKIEAGETPKIRTVPFDMHPSKPTAIHDLVDRLNDKMHRHQGTETRSTGVKKQYPNWGEKKDDEKKTILDNWNNDLGDNDKKLLCRNIGDTTGTTTIASKKKGSSTGRIRTTVDTPVSSGSKICDKTNDDGGQSPDQGESVVHYTTSSRCAVKNSTDGDCLDAVDTLSYIAAEYITENSTLSDQSLSSLQPHLRGKMSLTGAIQIAPQTNLPNDTTRFHTAATNIMDYMYDFEGDNVDTVIFKTEKNPWKGIYHRNGVYPYNQSFSLSFGIDKIISALTNQNEGMSPYLATCDTTLWPSNNSLNKEIQESIAKPLTVGLCNDNNDYMTNPDYALGYLPEYYTSDDGEHTREVDYPARSVNTICSNLNKCAGTRYDNEALLGIKMLTYTSSCDILNDSDNENCTLPNIGGGIATNPADKHEDNGWLGNSYYKKTRVQTNYTLNEDSDHSVEVGLSRENMMILPPNKGGYDIFMGRSCPGANGQYMSVHILTSNDVTTGSEYMLYPPGCQLSNNPLPNFCESDTESNCLCTRKFKPENCTPATCEHVYNANGDKIEQEFSVPKPGVEGFPAFKMDEHCLKTNEDGKGYLDGEWCTLIDIDNVGDFSPPIEGQLWLKINDDFIYPYQGVVQQGVYEDNVSSYSVTVRGRVKSNELSKALHQFTEPLRATIFGDSNVGIPSIAQSLYEHLLSNNNVIIIIQTCLVLFVIIQGILFMMGVIKQITSHIIIQIIKVSVVVMLITPGSWVFFNTHLFSTFTDGAHELMSIMAGGFSNSIVGESTVYDPTSGISYLNTTGTGTGDSDTSAQGYYNPITYIGDNNPNTQDGVPTYVDPSNLRTKLSYDPFGPLTLTITQFFSPYTWTRLGPLFLDSFTGAVFAIIVTFSMILYLFMVIWAVIVYIMSFFALSLLFTISPVMLTFILFEKTKPIFESWMKQMLNFALQPIILFTVLAIFNVFIYSAIQQALDFDICQGCHEAWLIGEDSLIGGLIPGTAEKDHCLNYSYIVKNNDQISFSSILAFICIMAVLYKFARWSLSFTSYLTTQVQNGLSLATATKAVTSNASQAAQSIRGIAQGGKDVKNLTKSAGSALTKKMTPR